MWSLMLLIYHVMLNEVKPYGLHIYTHIYIYKYISINIYIYGYVCVCQIMYITSIENITSIEHIKYIMYIIYILHIVKIMYVMYIMYSMHTMFDYYVYYVYYLWRFWFPLPLEVGWPSVRRLFRPSNVQKINAAPPNFEEKLWLFGTYIFQQAFCRKTLVSFKRFRRNRRHAQPVTVGISGGKWAVENSFSLQNARWFFWTSKFFGQKCISTKCMSFRALKNDAYVWDI